MLSSIPINAKSLTKVEDLSLVQESALFNVIRTFSSELTNTQFSALRRNCGMPRLSQIDKYPNGVLKLKFLAGRYVDKVCVERTTQGTLDVRCKSADQSSDERILAIVRTTAPSS
jgi:hypothetical protein